MRTDDALVFCRADRTALVTDSLIIVAVVIGGYLYVSRRNSTAIGSIAVMPFVNGSGNPDVEYLSDGALPKKWIDWCAKVSLCHEARRAVRK